MVAVNVYVIAPARASFVMCLIAKTATIVSVSVFVAPSLIAQTQTVQPVVVVFVVLFVSFLSTPVFVVATDAMRCRATVIVHARYARKLCKIVIAVVADVGGFSPTERVNASVVTETKVVVVNFLKIAGANGAIIAGDNLGVVRAAPVA
jgi:hypothetical protein